MTEIVQSLHPPPVNQVRFSVAAHAAWAPGRETPAAWLAWAADVDAAATADAPAGGEPALSAMPPMLRRRAGPAGKMALQAAYAAAGPHSHLQDIPAIFSSRHGECGRSADLLTDLARQLPLSPAAFSLSVHNATGGLFSIARHDHANSLALAAGHSTIEHAVIEACSLLADGAPAVLLVAADGPLPPMYRKFADCDEQPFGWAWLLQAPAAGADAISLGWSLCADGSDDDGKEGKEGDDGNDGDNRPDRHDAQCAPEPGGLPGGLQIMRFFLRGDACLQRKADRRRWTWSRNEGLQ